MIIVPTYYNMKWTRDESALLECLSEPISEMLRQTSRDGFSAKNLFYLDDERYCIYYHSPRQEFIMWNVDREIEIASGELETIVGVLEEWDCDEVYMWDCYEGTIESLFTEPTKSAT